MLSMPILNGRIGKWILALSEFELKFELAKAIKGQIIADFITEHRDPSVDLLEITPWALFFDGSYIHCSPWNAIYVFVSLFGMLWLV
jgi:hypothetical protein